MTGFVNGLEDVGYVQEDISEIFVSVEFTRAEIRNFGRRESRYMLVEGQEKSDFGYVSFEKAISPKTGEFELKICCKSLEMGAVRAESVSGVFCMEKALGMKLDELS